MADSRRVSPAVVLLGRDDAVRAQLRNALVELGARVVFEDDIVSADPAKVAATSPEVVLLNLDAEGEDALDRLDGLLLDPSVKVVFNEAETTASLSGWDLARWARHLAAKVLGHDQTIPPAPVGSEYTPDSGLLPSPGAPPTPESQSAHLSIETLQDEANLSAAEVPSSASLSTSQAVDRADVQVSDKQEAPELGTVDVSEIENALTRFDNDETDDNSGDTETGLSEKAAGEQDNESEFAIDLSDLEVALANIDADNPSAIDDDDDDDRGGDYKSGQDKAGQGWTIDDAVEKADSSSSAGSALDIESMIELESNASSDLAPLELDDTGDFRASDNVVAPPIRLNFADDDDGLDDAEIDEAVAALAAQLESLDDSSRDKKAVRDPDFSFELADDDEPAAPVASARPSDRNMKSKTTDAEPEPVKFDVSKLGLEDDLVEAQKATTRITTEAPAIDIGYLSLEDLPDPGLLVAPPSTKHAADEPYVPRPGIDLELAPLGSFDDSSSDNDSSERHSAVKADVGESEDSFDFDLELAPLEDDQQLDSEPAAGIRRVLVLGASIGGPDALRTFLGGLPVNFPALVVLAQHLESGFFDRLAQQLQKVCKLPVRVSRSGRDACESEVLIVPSGERVLIETSGAVSHEAHSEPTHYRPCIDDVMRDIADRFGKRATAIIFSGMAGDAVEGAVYLTGKGGEVWAQNPDSCVVSSMVDGAQARGVVEFVGTPRELADRCISRFGGTG